MQAENRKRMGYGILSALVLGGVAMFVYASSLTTGFFADDYNFLEPVARLGLSDYLARYFDPRLQTLWYRPLQGVQILLEYKFFGANPMGYHAVNVAFHAINVALLFALIWRVANKWRVAFIAALFYATFPVYALAINWINITDPLATIFYLLGIWFWLNYRDTGKRRHALITLTLYALALLTKQMAVTLPAVLFLLERLVLAPPPAPKGPAAQRLLTWLDVPQTLRRYWAFGAILIFFIAVQYNTQSTHTFAGVFGYALGAQLVSILIQYLSLTVFPWGYFIPNDTQVVDAMPFSDERNLIWLAVALGLFVFVTLRSRNRGLTFLGLTWLVTIAPVLPFPFIELRYLYLPAMVSGILLALWFDFALARLPHSRWMAGVVSFALALLVMGSYFSIAHANAGIAEIARQRRVPFRDISQANPMFPPDTRLYFIDSITPLSELAGMFTLRYGSGVTVSGTDHLVDPVAHLRDHAAAFVFYFDDTGKPHQVAVEPGSGERATPALPIVFAAPLSLENVELARTTLTRGDVMIALLYWRATGKIEKDYTVFVHLVDRNGKMIAGSDSPPRKGNAPTGAWEPGRLLADGIVLPIPSDAPIDNDAFLEIGIYDPANQQRVPIQNSNTDTLVIAPLRLIEK